MTIYTHLTEQERYHIYLMNKQHCTLTGIAKTMGRSKSIISREIKRNTGGNGYRYKQAHRFAQTRHQQKPKHIKLNDALKLRLGELAAPHIQQKLALYWSPEQICGGSKLTISLTFTMRAFIAICLETRRMRACYTNSFGIKADPTASPTATPTIVPGFLTVLILKSVQKRSIIVKYLGTEHWALGSGYYDWQGTPRSDCNDR